jgi:hypothetical protein
MMQMMAIAMFFGCSHVSADKDRSKNFLQNGLRNKAKVSMESDQSDQTKKQTKKQVLWSVYGGKLTLHNGLSNTNIHQDVEWLNMQNSATKEEHIDREITLGKFLNSRLDLQNKSRQVIDEADFDVEISCSSKEHGNVVRGKATVKESDKLIEKIEAICKNGPLYSYHRACLCITSEKSFFKSLKVKEEASKVQEQAFVANLLEFSFPDKPAIVTNQTFQALKAKYELEWNDETWTWNHDLTSMLLTDLQKDKEEASTVAKEAPKVQEQALRRDVPYWAEIISKCKSSMEDIDKKVAESHRDRFEKNSDEPLKVLFNVQSIDVEFLIRNWRAIKQQMKIQAALNISALNDIYMQIVNDYWPQDLVPSQLTTAYNEKVKSLS